MPLESPSAPQDAANCLQRPVDTHVFPNLKPPVNRASHPALSSAPQVYHRGTASAAHPLAPEPSLVAPPIPRQSPNAEEDWKSAL